MAATASRLSPAEAARAVTRELLAAEEPFPPDVVPITIRTAQLVKRILALASAVTARGGGSPSGAATPDPARASDLALHVIERAGMLAVLETGAPEGAGGRPDGRGGSLEWAERLLAASREVFRERVECSPELRRLLAEEPSEPGSAEGADGGADGAELATAVLRLAGQVGGDYGPGADAPPPGCVTGDVLDASRALLRETARCESLRSRTSTTSSDELTAHGIRCATAALVLASRAIGWTAKHRPSRPAKRQPAAAAAGPPPREAAAVRRDPPRRVLDLDEPDVRREEAVRVATARMVFADHALLQRDFPGLREAVVRARRRELEAMDPPAREAAIAEALDRWLVENAAVVSAAQARQTEVNTAIATRGGAVEAFRPPRYGRALVLPVEGSALTPGANPAPSGAVGGLLDLKGAGVAPDRAPRTDVRHSDGLLPLADAFYEYLLQQLVEAIFEHAGVAYSTVPFYALLDLGFDGLGSTSAPPFPAGMIVRRAHRRPRGGRELPRRGSVEHRVHLEIEMLLRHYGVSSCRDGIYLDESGDNRGFGGDRFTPYTQVLLTRLKACLAGASGGREGVTYDAVRKTNLQTTAEAESDPDHAQLVDLASFAVLDAFDDPVLSQVGDRPFRWGTLVRPRDPLFVQPRPELHVPHDRWGTLTLEPWTAELARRFRAGELDGNQVRETLDRFVASTASRWP